jgi:hypothetical protein
VTDIDYQHAFEAIGNTGVSAQEAANALRIAYGTLEAENRRNTELLQIIRDTQDALWGIAPVVTMADGTPIVDAEPFEFRRNGVWYRADGTPVGDDI